MTFFKTAWRSLCRNPWMNVFACLQLCAALVVTAVMVSSLSIRYAAYKPFSDYLNGKGFLLTYGGMAQFIDTETQQVRVVQKEDFASQFPDASGIISCYIPFLDFRASGSENMNVKAISLDDELIKRTQPSLIEGRWLQTEANVVEAVVSENMFGWNVGDMIQVKTVLVDKPQVLQVKIVGKLKEGAKVPIGQIGDTTDYNQIYYPYSFAIEQTPLMLLSYSSLQNTCGTDIIQNVGNLSFMMYPDSTDDSKIAEDMQKTNSFGLCSCTSFTDCLQSSRVYLKRELYNLLPVAILLLTLNLVSTVSSTALSVRRRLHDYAIFYITGLRWKSCLWINFLQSAIVAIFSVVLSMIAIMILPHIAAMETLTLIWNAWLVCAELGFIIVNLIVSIIMPLWAIGSHTPREILTK